MTNIVTNVVKNVYALDAPELSKGISGCIEYLKSCLSTVIL